MSNISATLRDINPRPVPHFDKLTFHVDPRTSARQQDRLVDRLSGVSSFAEIRTKEFGYGFERILTVTVPSMEGLHLIAEHRELMPRSAEVALEEGVQEQWQVQFLTDLFIRHFYEPRHKGRIRNFYETSIYTDEERRGKERRGHQVFCYPRSIFSLKKPKVVSEPHCLRIETPYYGLAALRQIGIGSCEDFPTFNYKNHWEKHFRFYEVDRSILGRQYDNKLKRKRRRETKFNSGEFHYDEDRSRGSMLFRARAYEKELDEYTIQKFVEEYGWGRYMKPIDVTPLLPS